MQWRASGVRVRREWLALAAVGLLACGGGGSGGGGSGGGGVADSGFKFDASAGGTLPDGSTPTGDAAGGTPQGGPDLSHCPDDAGCPEGYFCDLSGGGESGACKPGCRQDPNTCIGDYQCDDTHTCVLDTHCTDDNACPENTWCNAGACVDGCKVVTPDACPVTMDGRRQLCDAATHACTVATVCCAADDTCSLTLPSACTGDKLDGQTSCVNPNPCEGRCANDDACPAGQFCGANGVCALGCRPGVPRECPAGQICDADTHVCGFRGCAADSDCPAAQFCGADATCSAGCRTTPDNCPVGEFCQSNRECGSGCEVDQNCADRNGPGWYCEAFACHRPCAHDVDCDGGAYCNVDTGRCLVGCRPDVSEPNDDLGHAAPLAFANGVHYDSGPILQTACQQNHDFYRFDTPDPGWGIHVHAAFTNGDGDLDLRLLDANGQVLVESGTPNDGEDALYPQAGTGIITPAGHYFVEIFPRGLDENSYRLTIDLSPPGGCVPDATEAGHGDDAAIDATSLSLPDLLQTVTVEGHTLCPGDTDWYALRMGARDGMTVLLTAGAGMGDLDFGVYGPGVPGPGAEPVFVPTSFQIGDQGERLYQFQAVKFNAAIQDGDYYIRVNGVNADQTAGYTLAVSVDRDRALCLADVAEPNDRLDRAYDLMGVAEIVRPRVDGAGNELIPDIDLVIPDLWLCSGEQDWYRVSVTNNDDLVARIVRQEAVPEGDTRIEIRDNRGQVVGLAGRSGLIENAARAQHLAAGNYYVTVSGVAMTQAPYNLVVNRTTSAVACAADALEGRAGNDVLANASAINFGTQSNLTLCGADGDEDWYVVSTDTEGTLTVSLNFLQAQGDLEVDIFRDGSPIAENAGSTDGHGNIDGENVQLRNRPAARYYIHVYGLNLPNARYDLTTSFEPRVFQCSDDPDEPNARPANASYLGQGQINGRATQWICDRVPRDEDWFQVDVLAGTQRTILSTYVFGDDGDLYIEAYDADQMLAATTGEISRGPAKQCIVIDEAPTDRTFFLRVVPLSVNVVLGDEQLDYQLYLLNGDACDAVGLPSQGVVWPRVP